MSLLRPSRPTSPLREEEALIREARRRQRRRRLVAGVSVTLLAALASTLTALNLPGGPHHRIAVAVRKPARTPAPRPAGPGPIPHSVGTTVLLWPGTTEGPGDSGLGPMADDLATGHLAQTSTPDISVGDYQPLAVRTGDWIVYVGNGVDAIRASLTGAVRVLGGTSFFVPAAQPGYVWLWYIGRHVIRLAAAGGGRLGPAITLPAGSQPIAGTSAGMLLTSESGQAELWRPGSAPMALPGSNSYDGFAVSARQVAYGTGCKDVGVAPDAPYGGNAAYDACRTLRVLDVASGRLSSFPAPRGTLGWVPWQFDVVDSIAPDSTMMAAEAAVPSRYDDQGRLYVIPLAGAHQQPRVVPGSAGFVLSKIAWSVRGGWLFYEGPGWKLWAYQPATGDLRASVTPCCQYTVMTALPSATR